ncbi:hypothetical protein P5V15_010724 [Pogonomyrmex californicus]
MRSRRQIANAFGCIARSVIVLVDVGVVQYRSSHHEREDPLEFRQWWIIACVSAVSRNGVSYLAFNDEASIGTLSDRGLPVSREFSVVRDRETFEGIRSSRIPSGDRLLSCTGTSPTDRDPATRHGTARRVATRRGAARRGAVGLARLGAWLDPTRFNSGSAPARVVPTRDHYTHHPDRKARRQTDSLKEQVRERRRSCTARRASLVRGGEL